MSPEIVVELARTALIGALTLMAPMLVVALVVGLAMGIAQTATGVQEQNLSLVPKLLAVGATVFLLLPWLLDVAMRLALHFLGGAGSLGR